MSGFFVGGSLHFVSLMYSTQTSATGLTLFFWVAGDSNTPRNAATHQKMQEKIQYPFNILSIKINVSMCTDWPLHFTHCEAESSYQYYLNSSWHGARNIPQWSGSMLTSRFVGSCIRDANLLFHRNPSCSAWLRSGDCGRSTVNSLSCSRNQFDLIWALWHGVILHEEVVRVRCGHMEMDMASNPQVGWGAETLKWY